MRSRPVLLLAALFASPALAAVFADLAVLDREIAAPPGAPKGAPGGAALPVDRRLRLSQCYGPLALSWYGSQRETVLVECPATGGWKIYMPLRIAVSASAATPIVARGEAVTVVVSGAGLWSHSRAKRWSRARLARGSGSARQAAKTSQFAPRCCGPA